MHTPQPKFIKSLESYSEGDAAIFFGREAEIDRLHEQVLSSQLMLLYGKSGAGKTSLIRCGLNGRFGTGGWHPVYVYRNSNILESWAASVGAQNPSADAIAAATSVLLGNLKSPLFFVFDQFEELFLQAEGAEVEAFFFAVRAIRTLGPRVRFIIVCREEYLAHFSSAERHLPDIYANRMRVLLMSPGQMSRVLAAMLNAAERPFEPQFLTMFEEVLRTEGEGTDLAGFQVYLEYLLGNVPPDMPLTAAHIGGRNSYRRAMERYITRQLSAFPDPARGLELLKRMVSSKGTKLCQERAALLRLQPDSSDQDLAALVDLHLLRYLPESDAFELLHDALAKSIFEKFSRTDRERIEVQEFVRIAYQRHLSHEVELTDDDLQYIASFKDELVLSVDEAAYLQSSFEARDLRVRVQQRTQQWMRGLAVGFTAIIGFFAVSAQLEVRKAEDQTRASQLAGLVLSGVEGRSLRRFAFASEAFQLDPQNNRNFEALLASAHHPTLEHETYERSELISWSDTMAIGYRDSMYLLIKAAPQGMRAESVHDSELKSNAYWMSTGSFFQPFGFTTYDRNGEPIYDFAGTPLEHWSNSSGLDRVIWGEGNSLLGAVFKDGEILEVSEAGQPLSHGKFTGDIGQVSVIRFGNRAGVMNFTNTLDAEDVIYLEADGAELRPHKLLPDGATGFCKTHARREFPCFCASATSASTSLLTVFDPHLEKVFEEEIPFAMEELKSGNASLASTKTAGLVGLITRRPNQLHHFALKRTFDREQGQIDFGEQGDLVWTRSSDQAGVDEVTLVNRQGREIAFEASHFIGWLPGGESFLLGATSQQKGAFELIQFSWQGKEMRRVSLPVSGGHRLKSGWFPSKHGTCLLTLKDELNVRTHCLVVRADFEVLGYLVLADVPVWGMKQTTAMAFDVAQEGEQTWLLNMTHGITSLTYREDRSHRIWPAHSTHFASECPERMFQAQPHGLQAFDLVEGRWQAARYFDYPGLSQAGEIESVHCSGEYIKLTTGAALRCMSAGGFRRYDIPQSLSDWTFSTTDRHPVELYHQDRGTVIGWIRLGDSLRVDTTSLQSMKWVMKGKDFFAKTYSWGRDTTFFCHVDLDSGQESAFGLAEEWGHQWMLEDVVDGHWVLSRWMPGSRVQQPLRRDWNGNELGPNQTIIWHPQSGERLDSMPWVRAIGDNLFSTVRIFRGRGSEMFRTDLAQTWQIGSNGLFEPTDSREALTGLMSRSGARWINLGIEHRAGAITGQDRKAELRFAVNAQTGAIEHLGNLEEVYHVINEDYAWLETSGMLEFRPRSLRAVEAMFKDALNP